MIERKDHEGFIKLGGNTETDLNFWITDKPITCLHVATLKGE